jgi:hypothetical protein
MDRVQDKPNSSVQHTPSAESFQVYLKVVTVSFTEKLEDPQYSNLRSLESRRYSVQKLLQFIKIIFISHLLSIC